MDRPTDLGTHGNGPVGIFDSGIGGLSVLRELLNVLPRERFIYIADQVHLPYGERSLEEVLSFSRSITEALLTRGCRLIVIACNTASAAALKPLRVLYPEVRFVGMEPAVKPAAEHSNSGIVGVLATSATFQGELFTSVVERFAQGVEVLQQPCPGLVERIEAGELDTPATEAMLRRWIEPMIARGIDALVLACTHYPFVRPLIELIAGPNVRVIDPAPAIAKQVERVLREMEVPAPATQKGSVIHFTTGDPASYASLAERLGVHAHDVRASTWSGERLLLA